MNIIKSRMKTRTRAWLAGIIALMLTVSVLPVAVFAVDAPVGTTSVISYTGFESADDINDTSETKWDGNGKRGMNQGQLDGNGVLVIDTTTSNGYLTAKFNRAGMTAGDQLVILGRVRLESGSGNVRIALLQNPNSTGGLGTKHVLTWVDSAKVAYGAGTDQLTSYSYGKWVDAATVITAGEGNTSATAMTYVDGIQIGDTPRTVASWSSVDHIGLVRQNAGVAYFDDVEAFIIPNGADVSTLNYYGVDTATIDQYGKIGLQFDSPIIEGTLAGKIKIDGTAVETDRLSLSGDRRSVIIAPPEGGSYPVGTRQLIVSIDAGIESYTGAIYSGGGSATVTIERDDGARRTDIVSYRDYNSEDAVSDLFAKTVAHDAATGTVRGELTGKTDMRRSYYMPDAVKALYQTDSETPYTMVFLSRMKLEPAEIHNIWAYFGLENDYSSTFSLAGLKWGTGVKRLQTVYQTDTAAPKGAPETYGVPADGWTDVAAVVSGEGDQAAVDYYFNGEKVSWDGGTFTIPDSNHFRLYMTGTADEGDVAYFDDVEAYMVTPGANGSMIPLNLAEVPLTDAGGGPITEVEENSSFVLHFDQPIIGESANAAVKVNNQAVSTSLTADRRGVIVAAPFEGWSAGSTLNISVSDLQGYGTEEFSTTNENLSLTVKAIEKPENNGTIVPIIDHQSFDDDDPQAYAWDRSNLVKSGGKLVSANTASTQMTTIKAEDYEKIITAIQESTAPIYVVIRAKMQLNEEKGSNPTMTLGLAYNSSGNNSGSSAGQNNVLPFVSLTPASGGSISFNTTGGAAANVSMPATLGQEEDITIVMSFANNDINDGQITYRRNGVEAASGVTKLGGNAKCIRLVIQGVDGSFDDVEVYCITGGRNKFEFNEIVSENGEAEVDPMDGVQVRFSSDLVKEKLLATNALSGFMVGNEQIPASRISISPDGNGAIIAPPAGGWDSQKTYTIKSTAGIQDILGTPIDEAVNTTFKTGGDMLTAQVLSAKHSGSTATASLKLRNANTEEKTLLVIMAEYTGQEDSTMMLQADAKPVTLGADATNDSVELSLNNLTTGSTVRVFVWESDNLNPVLDMPYTVK